MKKTSLLIITIAIIIINVVVSFFTTSNQAMSNANGAPSGVTGSPGDFGTTCHTSGCHSDGPAPANQTGWISSNIPGTGYTANTTYTITATATRAGHIKFGFEITPENNAGSFIGTLIKTSSQTQLTGSGKYITHTASGTSGSNSKTWTFNWTSPATGKGPVTFYGAFNITNSDNSSFGDTIYTSKLTVSEKPTGIAENNAENHLIKIFPTLVQSTFTINYNLEQDAMVDIKMMNISGKIVKQLYSDRVSPGQHNLWADCSDLANGIYLINSVIDNQQTVRKIVVCK